MAASVTGERLLAAAPEDAVAGRKVMMTCPTSTIDDFKRLVDLSVELGITHVTISDLLQDRWQWDLDRNDPYANWSIMNASLLKVAVPEALRPWVPYEHARRNLEIIARRGEILQKHGLKAAFSGCEPMWLPEGVYTAHPEWRGPHCQYPPRARKDFFAPCIDRPEVLAMYRRAAEELCRLAPFEKFDFLTNDSGSGICWSPGLYGRVNGPEWCKNRSATERVTGFMSAIQDGARAAGLEAEISIAGQRLGGRNQARRPSSRAGFGVYFYWANTYPVIEIPQPFAFAEQLEQVFRNPTANWSFSIPSVSSFASFDLLREFRKNNVDGMVARIQALNTVATHQAGAGAADSLLKTWENIGRAVDSLRHIESGGPVLTLGSVNQRWLVRPLVPFPLELKPQEKDYYRRFQFQARSEEFWRCSTRIPASRGSSWRLQACGLTAGIRWGASRSPGLPPTCPVRICGSNIVPKSTAPTSRTVSIFPVPTMAPGPFR